MPPAAAGRQPERRVQAEGASRAYRHRPDVQAGGGGRGADGERCDEQRRRGLRAEAGGEGAAAAVAAAEGRRQGAHPAGCDGQRPQHDAAPQRAEAHADEQLGRRRGLEYNLFSDSCIGGCSFGHAWGRKGPGIASSMHCRNASATISAVRGLRLWEASGRGRPPCSSAIAIYIYIKITQNSL